MEGAGVTGAVREEVEEAEAVRGIVFEEEVLCLHQHLHTVERCNDGACHCSGRSTCQQLLQHVEPTLMG